MSDRFGGYGAGWREPKASGTIARFRQKMREPISKADVWLALCAFPLTIFVIAILTLFPF